MSTTAEIQLLTTGRIAKLLDQPVGRVLYVLRTRGIRHAARAAHLRLYDSAAVRAVAAALADIDSRRSTTDDR